MPNLLLPAFLFDRLADITPEFLQTAGARGIIVDLDNTLIPPHTPKPTAEALQWLEKLHMQGIPVVLLSNNRQERVSLFCEGLSLPFVHRGAKPLPLGFIRAARLLKLPHRQIAVVGDQVLTDVLGARFVGMLPLLVRPIVTETGRFFRIKREFERRVLKNGGYDWI